MSKPDDDKRIEFDVVIKWAIKIAAVVFTAPASWEVAGGLYPEWLPMFRFPLQLAGVALVEGAMLVGWYQLDSNDKAEPEQRWLYAGMAVLGYVALLVIALQHEGLRGLVFRLTLLALLAYSVVESGILSGIQQRRKADRNIERDRKVSSTRREQERLTATLRYELTGERERKLLDAEHKALLDAELTSVKLRGSRLLDDVKREDRTERRKVEQSDTRPSGYDTFPHPIDDAQQRRTEQQQLDKDDALLHMLNVLANNPDTSKTALSEHIGRARNTVYDYLDELESNGWIERSEDTGSGYDLTPAGVQYLTPALHSNGNGHK